MTCNYCNSDNFKYLTSSTNSTYTYCRDCNTNFDIAYKKGEKRAECHIKKCAGQTSRNG